MFDGRPLDVPAPRCPGERIAFGFLTSQKFSGEVAQLKVLRKGEELTVDVKYGVCISNLHHFH